MNVFPDAMDQKMSGTLAKQLRDCDYAKEDMCTAVGVVGPDALQAKGHTGTDVPWSHQIKEDIRVPMRGSL